MQFYTVESKAIDGTAQSTVGRTLTTDTDSFFIDKKYMNRIQQDTRKVIKY